jgi:hypothetical protein
MKGLLLKKCSNIRLQYLKISYWLLLVTSAGIFSGCQKGVSPIAQQTSPAGQLSRYDLILSSYDPSPVNAFTLSYNSNNEVTDLFEKAGQTLLSYSLTYSGKNLVSAQGNDLSTQALTYDANGRPSQIYFTSPLDTGKLVFTYGTNGKLTAVIDSVKTADALPIRYQYLYTYDAAGSNVVKITKNSLDLQGRATLRQYSLYTFDDKPNPFTSFPYLQSSFNLPGDFPALVNKNNIVNTQLVGTVINTSSGGSAPTLDTITNYRSVRSYEYNSKGSPVKATEKFNDLQFNYSGNRTFTYEY